MKIAFMGTPEFSVNALKEVNKNFGVDTIFTQPPKKSNRGMKKLMSPVHLEGDNLSIEIRYPSKLIEDYNFFLNKKFDLVIVAAYGQIIPDSFLKECLFINIHASLLPKWRGAAPIQRSIMNRDSETGISIMKIEKELDSGPVMFQKKCPVTIQTIHGDLEKQLSLIGSELIVEAINKIKNNNFSFNDQNHDEATYAKKITKLDEEINWNNSAENIIAKIHALSPSPGSFFIHKDSKFKVFKCKIFNDFKGQPGEMLCEKNNLFIACKDKSIEVLEIQKSGKKKQNIKEFLRGNSFN